LVDKDVDVRYKRIDNLWFAVAHEIARVLVPLNEQTPYILDNLKEVSEDDRENEANRIASEKHRHPEIVEYLKDSLRYIARSKSQSRHGLGIQVSLKQTQLFFYNLC
jgi:hypothetical protein